MKSLPTAGFLAIATVTSAPRSSRSVPRWFPSQGSPEKYEGELWLAHLETEHVLSSPLLREELRNRGALGTQPPMVVRPKGRTSWFTPTRPRSWSIC